MKRELFPVVFLAVVGVLATLVLTLGLSGWFDNEEHTACHDRTVREHVEEGHDLDTAKWLADADCNYLRGFWN